MNWPGVFLKQTDDFMSDAKKLRFKKLQIINLQLEIWPYKYHLYINTKENKRIYILKNQICQPWSQWKHIVK